MVSTQIAPVLHLNYIMAGKEKLKSVIEGAEEHRLYNKRTILFVDEVHRWNKTQQDALLPSVETGLIILIGATTQNPYFDVIPALVSRSRIFTLKPLSEPHLDELLNRALKDPERGYGSRKITIDQQARDHLVQIAGGDARNLLNALELAVESTQPNEKGVIAIDLQVAQDSIQRRVMKYDRNSDEHYDTISAFIKSVRGSDPDAALYWLAKMLQAGEDPRFILRRLIILAGEDVGLADPQGIQVASAAAYAFEYIGMPEGAYPIVEATLYLATAPKSNSATQYYDVVKFIEENGVGQVPIHLMDANRDAKGFGHGQGYQYPHLSQGHFTGQQYLPDQVLGRTFYHPSDQGREKEIAERLAKWRKEQNEVLQKKKIN